MTQGSVQFDHARPTLKSWMLSIALFMLFVLPYHLLLAEEVKQSIRWASDELVIVNPSLVHVKADLAQHWLELGENVYLLRGRCQIKQGEYTLVARQMVVWIPTTPVASNNPIRINVYAEDDIKLTDQQNSVEQPTLIISLETDQEIKWELGDKTELLQTSQDPLYKRGIIERKNPPRQELVQTAYNQPEIQIPSPAPPLGTSIYPEVVRPNRHVLITPRSFVPYNIESSLSTDTIPNEQVTIITQGVNVLVEGIPRIGQLDLSADNVVIWTQADETGNFQPELYQGDNAPLQIYLEGNIEVRQAGTMIRATHAFYDIRESRGVILNAELKEYIPELDSSIRIRAARIRQLSGDQYHAQNAWISASRMDDPTYRIQSSDIFLENRAGQGWFYKTGPQVMQNGQTAPAENVPWVTSLDNRVYLGDVPILYTPYLSAPAEDPNIPIKNLTYGQDSVFGTQIKTTWNLPKLLGRETPEGQTWDLIANYYSERGPVVGLNGDYLFRDSYNPQEMIFGKLESIYINDHGQDNLGRDRRDVDFDNDNRGRLNWHHRQIFQNDLQFTAEIGYVSDRNFLEQYFENKFDQDKDQETLVELSQMNDNLTWSIFGRTRVNDYEYQTEWYPKADVSLLGVPLLNDWLNWSSRSSVGYGRINDPDTPFDPTDVFSPIPYMHESSGLVSYSRHEIDMPIPIGAFQVTPYVMGEAAWWQDGIAGEGIDRLYGSAGVRASVSFWKIFPEIQSDIFNLNGLAHKHDLGVDYYYADSNRDLSEIPQYNEFEDDAQERFRTRFLNNTFGGVLPDPFDPRSFIVRSGGARGVADPYHEILDDQHTARFTWRHRLQTKVGPPDRLRVKDWMTLDLGINYFLNPNDNNFGERWGLLTANYTWDIGARTKFLANTQVDFFKDAPLLWDVGLLNQRAGRGSMFVGYRQIQGGQLDSKILSSSWSYAMSEKWVATFGTAYDIAENQNRGQSFTFTRIGADFLFNVGGGFDVSRGNASLNFSIVPKIGNYNSSSTQLSSLLGIK